MKKIDWALVTGLIVLAPAWLPMAFLAIIFLVPIVVTVCFVLAIIE